MRWSAVLVMLAVSVGAVACSGDGEDDDLESTSPLTPEECVARGGTPIGDPGDGSTHRDGCPGGQTQIGSLVFGDEGGICCKQ